MPAVLKAVSGTVKCDQRIEKCLSPGRQTPLQVLAGLAPNVVSETPFIGCANAREVVHADIEAGPCSHRKQPFNGLWLDLDLLERLLLRKCPAIRTIPISVVMKCAPVLTSDTPVAYFVQSTGIIAVCENDLRETIRTAGRHVFGFIAAFDQNCPVCFPEKVIKQHDKIIWTVIHWVAIVRL